MTRTQTTSAGGTVQFLIGIVVMCVFVSVPLLGCAGDACSVALTDGAIDRAILHNQSI